MTLSLDDLTNADAETMLKVVCHEMYHAYQHRLVELYESLGEEERELLVFYETARYQYEFDNYIDGAQDYEGYSRQWCESHSDAYAEEAAESYYTAIYRYQNENWLQEPEG